MVPPPLPSTTTAPTVISGNPVSLPPNQSLTVPPVSAQRSVVTMQQMIAQPARIDQASAFRGLPAAPGGNVAAQRRASAIATLPQHQSSVLRAPARPRLPTPASSAATPATGSSSSTAASTAAVFSIAIIPFSVCHFMV